MTKTLTLEDDKNPYARGWQKLSRHYPT